MERISLRLLFYLETINQTLAQVAHRDLETIFWLGKQLAQIVRTWECITGNISVHKLDNCVFHVISLFPANINLPPYGKKPSEPNLWGSESRPPLWQRDPLLVCEDSAVCQSPFLTGLLLAFPFIQGKANTLWTEVKRCVSELGRTHMLRACHMLQKLVIIQFLYSIWDFLALFYQMCLDSERHTMGRVNWSTCNLPLSPHRGVTAQQCPSSQAFPPPEPSQLPKTLKEMAAICACPTAKHCRSSTG